MNPHLKALQAQLQELIAEAGSTQDAERVAALPGEMQEVQSKIDNARKLADAAGNANQFLNGSQGIQSVASMLSSEEAQARDAAKRARGASITFTEKVGTDLMVRGLDGTMHTIGAEGWDVNEKQFRAISEPVYAQALTRMMAFKGDVSDFKMLSEGSDGDGGYLVPPQWDPNIIARKAAPTRLLSHVNEAIGTRDKYIAVRVNYDSDTGDIYNSGMRIQWIGEQGPTPSGTDPAFGDVEIPIFTGQYSVELTRNLLEDSPYNVRSTVLKLADDAYRLGIENVVVNGTGVNQPKGFLINPGGTLEPPYYNLGNPITADKLTNTLVYGLPEQYADDPDETIAILNRMSAFATFSTLSDTSGQRIFGLFRTNGPEGMAGPVRPFLHGSPCIFSAFMPNVGANAFPIAFGNLKEAYTLVRRIGFSVMPYGDQDKSMLQANKVGWMFRFRAGGDTVQNRALHIGKQA